MTKIYLRNVKWEMKIITCLNEEATGIAPGESRREPLKCLQKRKENINFHEFSNLLVNHDLQIRREKLKPGIFRRQKFEISRCQCRGVLSDGQLAHLLPMGIGS